MCCLKVDAFTKIQIKVLNNIFDELNRKSFRYCVLRNFEKLPVYIGNDLDLLIEEKKIKPISEMIIQIMTENDFNISKKIERYGHLGLHFTHSKFNNKIIFDLLTKSLKIWYEYADSKYILDNTIAYRNFFIPKKGSIIYTVVIKDLLTYGFVREKNKQLIDGISHKDEESFIFCGKPYFSRHMLKNVFEDLINNNVRITKKQLFCRLQTKVRFLNIMKYIFFRIKEIIKS